MNVPPAPPCRPIPWAKGKVAMGTARFRACLGPCPAPPLLAAAYTLLATPETVAWGYYSGTAKPVLTVHSGDTVRMETLSTCGSPERMLSGGVTPAQIPS